MNVRSGPIFALSLMMLATSATLGAVLVHDGEIGTDEAKLAYAEPGDHVGLKGIMEPFTVPSSDAWVAVRNIVYDATFLLEADVDVMVLVTGLAAAPDEAVVVHGEILYNGPHPVRGDLVILDVQEIDQPYFDWS